MKILVIGASGNVGSYVVNELLKLEEEVVAAGTDLQKLYKMFGSIVSSVEFDFTRSEIGRAHV